MHNKNREEIADLNKYINKCLDAIDIIVKLETGDNYRLKDAIRKEIDGAFKLIAKLEN